MTVLLLATYTRHNTAVVLVVAGIVLGLLIAWELIKDSQACAEWKRRWRERP